VPTRKRDRSVMSGTRSWSSSLDMASIPTRRRSPNNCRHGNGVRQQGLVSRRESRRLQRACSRCDSTETPHWRAGPDGPGTLCNACGIRYTRQQCKLLLLPEYTGRRRARALGQEGVVKLELMKKAKIR
jgi:hypothetical protein